MLIMPVVPESPEFEVYYFLLRRGLRRAGENYYLGSCTFLQVIPFLVCVCSSSPCASMHICACSSCLNSLLPFVVFFFPCMSPSVTSDNLLSVEVNWLT